MKNKAIRHKEANTFKFKLFSERVAEIDVDVFHRVGHINEDRTEEVETHFHETLQKWNDLNRTDGYNTFRKQVQDIVTLPELLHKKRYVIDLLMEYLKKQDILFLQPILELVIAMAKDLQKEFYEYFPKFLSEIIHLLQTKNTEQIECAFTTLAYLFKFLWRYLIRNIKIVTTFLLPLLADTQPVYINKFAAESFAFVVRKLKDKDSFVKLILRILQDNTSGISGCGKLLFEIVYGTPGLFHSCAEQILPLYFSALQDEAVDQKLTYEVLKEIVTCIIQNVHAEKCSIVWDVILRIIDSHIERLLESSENSKEHALIPLLRLVHIIINHKNGEFLIDAAPCIRRLILMMDTLNIRQNNSILQEIIKVSVAILLAPNVKLMQENSSKLLLKIMAVDNMKLLHAAVEDLIHYPLFEMLVLPHVLRRSISIGFNSKILLLFTKIIAAKRSPCFNGIALDKWRKYILDVRNIGTESINYFLRELRTLSTDDVSHDAARLLIVLPHLKPLCEEFKSVLKSGLLSLYQKISRYNKENLLNVRDIDKITFIFLLTLESIVHISEPNDLHEFLIKSNIKIIELVNKHRDNTYVLNAVDLCLTYFSTSLHRAYYISFASFNTLHDNVVTKMSSPYSSIRLIIAHMYSLFANVEGLTQMQDGRKNAMELIYLAECQPVTMHNYRDRLMHLQALEFHSDVIANLDPKYHQFPLRYLIGNLYVNFSLLWEPINVIVASYSNRECPQFWSTFLTELTSKNEPEIERSSFDCHVLTSLAGRIEKYDDKPDFQNHRILLWKCMVQFPHYAEMKNRDLTGLFINFVNTNFFKSNFEEGKVCNIEKRKELSIANNDTERDESDNNIKYCDEEEEKEEEEEEEEDGKGEEEKKEKKRKTKVAAAARIAGVNSRNYKIKLLIVQMEIFDKMLNPKMLHREAEMRQIYLDLLSSRNCDVQRAALNCLLAYKLKYLLPYKESLYGLINEKNLKNELTRFKLECESNVILEEHREDLVPIVLRIVYAKMIAKIGMRTGGKAGGLARRKIILRFLAGAQEKEMIMFVKMAFKPFRSYTSLWMDEAFDLRQHVSNIIDAVDLTNVMPPKRMQSAVNLLGIVMEHFGGMMSTELLPHLLGILICILAEVTGILRKSEAVYTGYLPAIKTIRTSCIGILARFFTHFENYEWKRHEIEALYDVAIFPWLQRLSIEGIHSPTALLKLFMAWGQNSRYYPLFVKHRDDDESVSPLPYVIQLLLNPNSHRSVVNAILEIIEKMLTLQDYGKFSDNTDETEMDNTPFLSLTPVLANLPRIDERLLATGVNYGSAILLPHISSILEFIESKLKRFNKGVSRIELVILSRVSEFVTDAGTCDTLLTLILPILIKKATLESDNEEVVMKLLTTIMNLIKIVDRPEIHMRSIAPLIGFLSDVTARKLFIQLYGVIAERSAMEHREAMARECKVLTALNAWDRKWIDQPDFQTRLDAFHEISSMIENAITLEFGVAIMYNCFYFLKTESDLAMRDYSGQCLRLIGSSLTKRHKSSTLDRHYLLDDTILALARKGITSKNETVRLQSIALLGHMALECADVHPILRDLSLLVNRTDVEVDFFENMQHLQLHRKARALLKFCALAKTLDRPISPKTLTQFILPLCSSYLCNEAFIHKNSIIDAAIKTIGVACKFLPWHNYEILLNHYLKKLKSSVEFQKQVVRIVVTILDSFHYDLSKYKPTEGTKDISVEAEDKDTFDDEEETKQALDEDDTLKGTQEEEKELEEMLNNDNVESIEEMVERSNEVMKENVPIIEKLTLLSQYGARRVVLSIANGLLPQLHRAIVGRTRQDSNHKINRKKITSEMEEDDLLRIPVALALVKLLQKMPENLLDTNLPGIFMKLCMFLKSRMESVRRAAREILQKIMITLGPKYLHHLLREMNTLLTKGFQVHVLVYSIQSVLSALKPYFQKFDINNNLQSILSVCKVDLFGLTAEEKEIVGIIKHVSEAKSIKSFDIFHILAEFITESCLLDLILPLKEVLLKTHSHKTIHKIVECLRNITLGLADNAYIPLEQMLIFLYGIISESIPNLVPERENKKLVEEETNTEASIRQKPDCFIIPPEPKNRMGIKAMAKTTKSINAHIMIEFGLKLYHILLKRDKISGLEYKSHLESFVPLLSNCLNSQHVKVNAV